MKRLALLLLLLLAGLSLVSAGKVDDISQPIAGYISSTDFCTLDITNYFNSNVITGVTVNGTYYRGINLDTDPATNTSNDRDLITPYQSSIIMGKRIGAFNMKASHHGYTLTVTHEKLSSQNGTSYDYELGISFKLNDSTFEQACSSSNSVSFNFAESAYGNDGVLILNDGGIYFRLIDTVTQPGQYSSVVTFIVEANGNNP